MPPRSYASFNQISHGVGEIQTAAADWESRNAAHQKSLAANGARYDANGNVTLNNALWLPLAPAPGPHPAEQWTPQHQAIANTVSPAELHETTPVPNVGNLAWLGLRSAFNRLHTRNNERAIRRLGNLVLVAANMTAAEPTSETGNFSSSHMSPIEHNGTRHPLVRPPTTLRERRYALGLSKAYRRTERIRRLASHATDNYGPDSRRARYRNWQLGRQEAAVASRNHSDESRAVTSREHRRMVARLHRLQNRRQTLLAKQESYARARVIRAWDGDPHISL